MIQVGNVDVVRVGQSTGGVGLVADVHGRHEFVESSNVIEGLGLCLIVVRLEEDEDGLSLGDHDVGQPVPIYVQEEGFDPRNDV